MTTAEVPEFYPIKGGWAARPVTGGWAVHGKTKEEAAAKFAEAVRRHAEIRARPENWRSELRSDD